MCSTLIINLPLTLNRKIGFLALKLFHHLSLCLFLFWRRSYAIFLFLYFSFCFQSKKSVLYLLVVGFRTIWNMKLCCLGISFVPQLTSQILILKQNEMEPCNLVRVLYVVFPLTTSPLKKLDNSFCFPWPKSQQIIRMGL